MVSLNPEQKIAVESVHGRVLVLAGAGSGKTSVLISRSINLIDNHNVLPSEILGLTFTNKAAHEMRQRISKRIGQQKAKELTLTTFHSFCLSVLKSEIHRIGYSNQFSIYDERDMQRLEQTVERAIAETGKEKIDDELLKTELLKCMKAYNAVDFDGLLSLTVELFEKCPDVLERFQKQFRYIMIDEYQDTNAVQYKLAKLLSDAHGNLFVVGDDDQSIYGWRGAEVDHILNFKYETLVTLEENYRSTKQILDAANTLISHNKGRHLKNLWSRTINGDPVHLFHAPTQLDEAEAVVDRINRLRRDKHLKWSDFAILYRSNALSRPFEAALMKASWKSGDKFIRGIPYRVVQGTEFYERSEVKDLLSYLQVIINPNDQRALLRILNYPRRGISMKTIEALTEEQKNQKTSLYRQLQDHSRLDISDTGHAGIDDFLTTIRKARELFETTTIEESIKWLIEELKLKDAICQEFKSEEAQMYKWDNILTILEMGANFDKDNLSLHDFLSSTMLDQTKQDKATGKGDMVNLLTLHSAKGLEFTACFIIGLEDGVIPHEKSLAETGIEEERRLLYVGITRAKKYLTLSMSKTRKSHGKDHPTNPSRFLFELPKDQLLIESFDHPAAFTF